MAMIVKVVIEIICAAVILFFGNSFWEFPKRARFLRDLISNQHLMVDSVLPNLRGPTSATAQACLNMCTSNYPVCIGLLAKADKVSQRGLKILNAVTILAALIGSHWLGPIYLVVRIAAFALSGLGRISDAAAKNAFDHILEIGFILQKWHQEDEIGCERWMQQAPQASAVGPLNRIVKISA
jgi:hypothetical protein